MRLAKSTLWLCAGVAAFAFQSAAQANSTQMTVTARFSDIVASPETDYRLQNNDPSGQASLNWHPDEGGNSLFRFDGNRLPGQGNLDFIGFDNPFVLGRLTFDNGASNGSPAVSGAGLGVSFFWGDASMSPVELIFGLSLTEQTLALSDHKDIEGDLLSLSATTRSFLLDTATGKFRLDLLGWSQDGGQSFIDSLFVPDHSHEGLKLYASLQAIDIPPDPQAVPVPTAVWLLGSGLVALAGTARRR